MRTPNFSAESVTSVWDMPHRQNLKQYHFILKEGRVKSRPYLECFRVFPFSDILDIRQPDILNKSFTEVSE